MYACKVDTKPSTYELLARYLAGDLSKREASSLKSRVLGNDLKSNFSQIEEFWNMKVEDEHVASRISRRTWRKISFRNFRDFQNNFLGYVAVVLVVVAIGFGLYSWAKHYPVEQIEYITDAGQVNEVSLPDGSKVWLNAKSKLTYTQYLIGSDRYVSLDGEAYFHVVSDSDKPFFVSTSDAQIKVTGTRFAVSAYHDDPFVTTHLEEGIVTFMTKKSDTEHKLAPGQLVQLDRKSESLEFSTPENLIAGDWKNGELNFYDERFERIAKKLERRFDIDIQLTNASIPDLRFTAEFEQENLQQILNFIELASALKVKQQADGTYFVSLKN